MAGGGHLGASWFWKSTAPMTSGDKENMCAAYPDWPPKSSNQPARRRLHLQSWTAWRRIKLMSCVRTDDGLLGEPRPPLSRAILPHVMCAGRFHAELPRWSRGRVGVGVVRAHTSVDMPWLKPHGYRYRNGKSLLSTRFPLWLCCFPWSCFLVAHNHSSASCRTTVMVWWSAPYS
jgi:hypothetical protein